jgi:hypothetical protein
VELTDAKNEMVKLQHKLQKMVMTPLGTRSQLRRGRSLDQLAQKFINGKHHPRLHQVSALRSTFD